MTEKARADLSPDQQAEEASLDHLEQRLTSLRDGTAPVDPDGEPVYPPETFDEKPAPTEGESERTEDEAGDGDGGGDSGAGEAAAQGKPDEDGRGDRPAAAGRDDRGGKDKQYAPGAGAGAGQDDPGQPAGSTGDEGQPETSDAELLEGLKVGGRPYERVNYVMRQRDEARAQAEQLRDATQAWYDVVQANQARPEQVTAVMNLIGAVNLQDPARYQHAKGELNKLINQARLTAGETPELPATPDGQRQDIVDLFSDLKQAVDNLDITPQHARELATMRLRTQQQAAIQQQHQQAAQQTQEFTAAAQQGAKAVETWERHMMSTDPDFSIVQRGLAQQAEQVMKDTHPSQWLPQLQAMYDQAVQMRTAMAEQQRRLNPPVNPIGSSASGHRAEGIPEDPIDRMEMELAQMRGRA